MDLGGEPQCFQGGNDALADAAFLAVGVFWVFVADQLVVEGTLAGADGFAFRLGGVGGEDGLDMNVAEDGEDLLGLEIHRLEVAQCLGPEPADGVRAEGFFPLAADLGGDALLDHIEELEADRVELGEVVGRDFAGGGFLARPWHEGEELRFPGAGEGVAQATEEVGEAFVDEAEAFDAELVAGGGHETLKFKL